MRDENTNAEPTRCHACGAIDSASSKRKKSALRACAYCGARKRVMKNVDSVLDQLLGGS